MRFDIVTIFPAMVEQALGAGIVGRAIERGTLDVTIHDLRAFTVDRHRVVDDVPYGGGPGMVLSIHPCNGEGAESPIVGVACPPGIGSAQAGCAASGRHTMAAASTSFRTLLKILSLLRVANYRNQRAAHSLGAGSPRNRAFSQSFKPG